MEYVFGVIFVVIIASVLTMIMTKPLGHEVNSALKQNAELISQNFASGINSVIDSQPDTSYIFSVPNVDKCTINITNREVIVSSAGNYAIKTLLDYKQNHVIVSDMENINCNVTDIIKIQKNNNRISFETFERSIK